MNATTKHVVHIEGKKAGTVHRTRHVTINGLPPGTDWPQQEGWSTTCAKCPSTCGREHSSEAEAIGCLVMHHVRDHGVVPAHAGDASAPVDAFEPQLVVDGAPVLPGGVAALARPVADPDAPMDIAEQLSLVAPHIAGSINTWFPHLSDIDRADMATDAVERFVRMSRLHGDSAFRRTSAELAAEARDEALDLVIWSAIRSVVKQRES
jgi:hypothetical protein